MAIATNVQTATDADWDTVDDVVTITVARAGATVRVDIADGDQQLNKLQRNVADAANPVWKDIQVWIAVAANAVVLINYTTQRDNEELRVMLQTDGGGSGATSITEVNRIAKTSTDDRGRIYQNFYENGEVEFPGAGDLDITGLMTAQAAGSLYTGALKKEIVTITAAVLAAVAATHANKMIVLNNTTGFAYQLPAASGSGDVYEFLVLVTVSSGSMAIECTSGSAIFLGALNVNTDASGPVFVTDGNSNDWINMNGTTEGGVIGSYVRVVDVAVDRWFVSGALAATGTEVTPFSDAA